MLDQAAKEHWRRHGWVWLRGFLGRDEVADLARWTDEIAAWPETPRTWMRYYERPKAGPVASEHSGNGHAAAAREDEAPAKLLSRIENFMPFHDGLRGFLGSERFTGLLAECCGEPVVLFKDKINFKLPGGAGFADHQDAPAYVDFGVDHQLTMMLPVDAFTQQNGCLEVARDACERVFLPHLPDGTLQPEVMSGLEIEPLLAVPGDVILFDAWVPHRSGPNRSPGARRSYYLTYNPASAGDHREDYYARKRACFPPEYEREPGVDYAARGRQFNLGNPFD